MSPSKHNRHGRSAWEKKDLKKYIYILQIIWIIFAAVDFLKCLALIGIIYFNPTQVNLHSSCRLWARIYIRIYFMCRAYFKWPNNRELPNSTCKQFVFVSMDFIQTLFLHVEKLFLKDIFLCLEHISTL